jgi:uncharacterized membrane protein
MLGHVPHLLRGLPSSLVVAVLAALPVVERGAVAFGILVMHQRAVAAVAVVVVGNLLPVPFLLWGLGPVSGWLREHSKVADVFFRWLFDHARSMHGRRFERFRDLALVLVVAVPLPLFGPWTGSLCAFVFGVPPRRALGLIAAGSLVAAVLVAVLVTSGLSVLGIPAR